MEHSHFERMAARIPRARVVLNKSRWMTTFGITSYLTFVTIGGLAFFFIASPRIFNPYTFHPKKKVYKAHPDYVNGTVVFYEKEVDNVINDL